MPLCKECGHNVKFLNSSLGYRVFCSEKCSTLNIDTKEKFKQTNLKKYGVVHPKKSDIVKDKYKNTCLEKYGVESYVMTDEFKIKNKKTCLEKYDVDNVFKSEIIKSKIKKTCLEKYGVEHPLQYYIFNDKQKKTSIIKYGGCYNKLNIYRDKYKISFINRFKDKLTIKSISDDNICECVCDCGKNHNFYANKYVIYNRLKSDLKVCTVCNPTYYISGAQLKIYEFISEFYNCTLSDRNIIKGELDIYISELKIGFEFNGLYWHNEINKEKEYHLNKTELCEQQGIQLIHIYEDDWLYKQDIVKSIIINKLGKCERLFARKCEIKEIADNKLIRDFLDKNHIQGYVGSKVKIGLFYDNELVSLMTFGNRRIAMKKTNEFELHRFCNKLNTNVIGGASRLFKYFIKNYNPIEITTYANRSISQGKLYETLGFDFICKTEPNYYYVDNKIRKHRFNFKKNKLVKQGFNPTKSEHEIMLERKIYRIYDSGNLKYIWKETD